jgi:hypothetical protein
MMSPLALAKYPVVHEADAHYVFKDFTEMISEEFLEMNSYQ